jgi:hypothetical protein
MREIMFYVVTPGLLIKCISPAYLKHQIKRWILLNRTEVFQCSSYLSNNVRFPLKLKTVACLIHTVRITLMARCTIRHYTRILLRTSLYIEIREVRVTVMVFNTTFNNISVISWRSVLLVEETGVPGENHSNRNKIFKFKLQTCRTNWNTRIPYESTNFMMAII